jgi:exodeoxyribonuclease VII small subunit
MTKNLSKLSFEDAMSKLEEIIRDLESGSVKLENAIELYSEGIKLQDHCQDKLRTAKLKIEKVVKSNNSLSVEEMTI